MQKGASIVGVALSSEKRFSLRTRAKHVSASSRFDALLFV